ncbi:hypothetical protein BJ912DRAFT_980130 [Pholiota molesta]|nr:hypothetical protein BJ912DRAFT_980130 [Pholiota molesta]
MEASLQLADYRLLEDYEVFYFPNFVTSEEEDYISRKINDSPQPQWKKLPNRRFVAISSGDITAKGTLVAQSLPAFIKNTTGAFVTAPHHMPNHVIMNEPHEDGPQYHPVVATLSLGSHAVFHYYRYQSESDEVAASGGHGKAIDMTPILSVLLEPRSLIISSGAMYTHTYTDPKIKESINAGIPLKRGVRYSLTCRDVGRVSVLTARR